MLALGACVSAVPAGPPAEEVRRLNGTKIPPSKIERIVTRLMQAEGVTGLMCFYPDRVELTVDGERQPA